MTNMGLAVRGNLQNGIAQSEIHRSYYSYTMSIDLDRVGVDGEINIAEEESKFGIHKEETLSLIRQIAALPHIQILGLMTIAPFVENPEDNRTYFRQIRQLSVDIDAQNIDNVRMDILSMGMTGDYMVAIEEGATMVRVGTGIFGERHYQK